MKFHIPPRFDLYGNRQLWIVETESGVDEVINGMLFALLVVSPIVAWSLW